MLTSAIKRFLEAKPFKPFTANLTDRSAFWIDNPKRAALLDVGEILRVARDDGGQILIAVRHIVSLTIEPSQDQPVVVNKR